MLAACIRRASSYSTTANAPANTSTSAVGRSPATRPIPGRSRTANPVACAHRSTTSAEADPSAPIARGSTTVCWSTVVLPTPNPPSLEHLYEHYQGRPTTPEVTNQPVDDSTDPPSGHTRRHLDTTSPFDATHAHWFSDVLGLLPALPNQGWAGFTVRFGPRDLSRSSAPT